MASRDISRPIQEIYQEAVYRLAYIGNMLNEFNCDVLYNSTDRVVHQIYSSTEDDYAAAYAEVCRLRKLFPA